MSRSGEGILCHKNDLEKKMSKLMILSHFLGSYFWVYFFHWPLKCNAKKQEAKLSFLIIFCLWLYGCSCCDHLSFGQSATKNVKNKIKNSFFDIFCCKTDNLFSILFVENTLTVTLHSSIGQTCIELFWRHFVSATLLLRFKHFKVLCSLSLHLSQITCSNQVTFEIYVYSKEI